MPSVAPPPSIGVLTRPGEDLERALDVDDLTVSIDGKAILKGVTFWVPKGEFVCLCGPNGAGKSTFLKTVLGLVKPKRGTVKVLGHDIGKGRGVVGYVPQRKTSDATFPATAVDLIVANLRGGWPMRIKDDEREAARSALDRVGGAHLLDKDLAGLSGGETQRVFLARALVTKPALLILDEPTAGVDVKGRSDLLDVLSELSQSDSLAAVLVTHNLSAVARCAERIVYLDAGRVRAWGLPKELLGHSSLSALAVHGGAHEGSLPDED